MPNQIGMILNLSIKTKNDYCLIVNSLYQLMYLRFICYKLKLMDVITTSTSLSISCYIFIWNIVQMNNGFYT